MYQFRVQYEAVEQPEIRRRTVYGDAEMAAAGTMAGERCCVIARSNDGGANNRWLLPYKRRWLQNSLGTGGMWRREVSVRQVRRPEKIKSAQLLVVKKKQRVVPREAMLHASQERRQSGLPDRWFACLSPSRRAAPARRVRRYETSSLAFRAERMSRQCIPNQCQRYSVMVSSAVAFSSSCLFRRYDLYSILRVTAVPLTLPRYGLFQRQVCR